MLRLRGSGPGSMGRERGWMMDGLLVGVDLCDEYTQIHCPEEEKLWTIPTVICRNKNVDEWYVGEEACAHMLKGDSINVDKLVNLAMRDGTATPAEVRYEGKELLFLFLERVLRLPKEEYQKQEIGQLVIAVKKLEPKLNRMLRELAVRMGILADRVQVISHSESYIYYTLSQKKEIWNNTVGMFDLSEVGLRYYEMKVQRGMKKTLVRQPPCRPDSHGLCGTADGKKGIFSDLSDRQGLCQPELGGRTDEVFMFQAQGVCGGRAVCQGSGLSGGRGIKGECRLYLYL